MQIGRTVGAYLCTMATENYQGQTVTRLQVWAVMRTDIDNSETSGARVMACFGDRESAEQLAKMLPATSGDRWPTDHIYRVDRVEFYSSLEEYYE